MDAGVIEMKKTIAIIKDLLILPIAFIALVFILIVNLFSD